jgi:hypothetical protein
MIITNKTTVKDVEGCPFIGVAYFPMFNHIELDETVTYDPFSFNQHKRVVTRANPININTFRGNYKDLVQNTRCKGGMVYFYPTIDGYLVHKGPEGEYVRMAQVKLTNYHFNQKVYESVRKASKLDVVEIPQKNYKYILIRR